MSGAFNADGTLVADAATKPSAGAFEATMGDLKGYIRGRVLPSGRPDEEAVTLVQADPTWALEYDHFKSLCRAGGSSLQTDLWINGTLNALRAAALSGEGQ